MSIIKLNNIKIVEDIDGNIYNTVTLGSQEWMVENLKTTHYADGTPILHLDSSVTWCADTSGAYCEYDNSTGVYKNPYGYFYNWYAINSSYGLAPTGWRVPSDTDIQTMINFCGGDLLADKALREVGYTHWESGHSFEPGTDLYGFKGVGSGSRQYDTGNFLYIKVDLTLWTSTQNLPGTYVWIRLISPDQESIQRLQTNPRTGLSVRCMRDTQSGSSSLNFLNKLKLSGSQFVYDIDKNQYTYVTIGTQQWMVQNLRTTKYADGTPVLKLESSAAWVVDTSGAYCEYDNSTSIYMNTYGYLYNGYAINSSHGLAPIGWRIPTHSDASLLSVFLGGEASAGGKLKEVGLTHWSFPNTGATDDYGFKGLPAGVRTDSGIYSQLGSTTNIWDGSTNDFQLHSALTSMIIYTHNSSYGFSVRCMRDLSSGFALTGSGLNKLKLGYELPFLTFYTEASTNTFDPTFTISSGILNWNLGDASSSVNTNNLTHTYSTVGNKTVKVYKGTTSGPSSITSIDMISDDLVGALDIHRLTNLSSFTAYSNPNLTQIFNPKSSQTFSAYYVYSCGLIGTLDLKSLTGLGGTIYLHSNPSLNTVLNPTSTTAISYYHVDGTNLTGTLDVSGLTGLGGAFYAYSLPNLNYILNPSSNQIFTAYAVNNGGLIGTLDLRGLTGLGGNFNCRSNPSLNYILNPNSSQTFSSYYAYSCGLTGTLDISGLTRLGGMFLVNTNASLNYILNPSTDETFSTYYAHSCDLRNTLDLRPIKKIGSDIELQGNSHLTNILFNSSPQVIVYFCISGCDVSTLDVSGLTGLSGNFWLSSNKRLNVLTLPTFTHQITSFDARDCCLNLTSVNDIFYKFNVWYTANSPASNAIINTSGGGNISPTGGMSNTDIVNIKAIFATAGKDASITIN
jgi:uncharacterized protein (TIGR02145 family)